MKAAVLSQFQYIWLTISGMMMFIGIFIIAVVRVFHPANRSMYSAIHTLPLEGEIE